MEMGNLERKGFKMNSVRSISLCALLCNFVSISFGSHPDETYPRHPARSVPDQRCTPSAALAKESPYFYIHLGQKPPLGLPFVPEMRAAASITVRHLDRMEQWTPQLTPQQWQAMPSSSGPADGVESLGYLYSSAAFNASMGEMALRPQVPAEVENFGRWE